MLGRFSAQANTVYAANLFGSAAGCILALGMPSLVGGEGAVSVCAGLAAVAALMNAAGLRKWSASSLGSRRRSRGLEWMPPLALGGSMTSASSLRLSPYKGLSYALQSPIARVVRSEWNAFSRIDVVTGASLHAVPGLSYRYLEPLPQMDGLFVDGDDLSPIVDDGRGSPVSAQRLAFQLRPQGSVLVLPRGSRYAGRLEMNTGPRPWSAIR
jgi:hypothetical protein